MLDRQIIQNLNLILTCYNYKTYIAAAEFLRVKYSTFRCWQSGNRTISLRKLDTLGDTLRIPTYVLLINNLRFSKCYMDQTEYLPNDSRIIFANNLDKIYKTRNKKTWGERESLFDGIISSSALMSYRRPTKNLRYPSIATIKLISSYLGVTPSNLLRKGAFL